MKFKFGIKLLLGAFLGWTDMYFQQAGFGFLMACGIFISPVYSFSKKLPLKLSLLNASPYILSFLIAIGGGYIVSHLIEKESNLIINEIVKYESEKKHLPESIKDLNYNYGSYVNPGFRIYKNELTYRKYPGIWVNKNYKKEVTSEIEAW
jgi:hypothetical protein